MFIKRYDAWHLKIRYNSLFNSKYKTSQIVLNILGRTYTKRCKTRQTGEFKGQTFLTVWSANNFTCNLFNCNKICQKRKTFYLITRKQFTSINPFWFQFDLSTAREFPLFGHSFLLLKYKNIVICNTARDLICQQNLSFRHGVVTKSFCKNKWKVFVPKRQLTYGV